jgi:hypothetical protein
MKIGKTELLKIKPAIFLVLLACIYTAIILLISLRIGRLQTLPFYDDCTYFRDASILVFNFKNTGIIALLDVFRQYIHSPYCFFISFISLYLANFQTKYCYIWNVIPVFAGLAACYVATDKSSKFLSFTLCLCALTLPIFVVSASEFRPDPFWGFLLALNIIYILKCSNISNCHTGLISGALLSVCLLIKPTTFPLTILLVGCALFLKLIFETQLYSQFNWENFKYNIPKLSKFLIWFLFSSLFSLIYFIPFGNQILEYFLMNAFGEYKSLWAPGGSNLDILGFYLWGHGGSNAMNFASILLILLALIFFIIILFQGDRNQKFVSVSLLIILCICYSILTWGEMKSVFVGFPFYSLLIVFCLNSISTGISVINETKFSFPQFGIVILVIIFVTGLFLFKFPAVCSVHPALAEFRNKSFEIVANYLKKEEKIKNIFFLRAGPVHPENIEILLLSQGIMPNVISQPLNPPKSISDFLNQKSSSELIIIAHDDIVGQQSVVKVGSLYYDIKHFLSTSPDYEEVFSISDYQNRSMTGYKKM